jgi:hypothetical protein
MSARRLWSAAIVAVISATACSGGRQIDTSHQTHQPTAAPGESRSWTSDVKLPASEACAAQNFGGLLVMTRVSPAKLSTALDGHLPTRLPAGFGLLEVDRTTPGGGDGYAGWTDSQCRRINLFFEPGETKVRHATRGRIGPWVELPRCGTPRPCIVYQAATEGGRLEFSTWRLSPVIAAAVLRSVAVGNAPRPS